MLLAAAIAGLFLLPGPWNILAFCAAAVIEVGELYLWKRFLDRYRVRGGAEGMIGERGEVTEPCDPEGQVMVRGEIWKAVAPDGRPFAAGDRVRVTGVDGLTLRINTLEPVKV